MPSVPLGEIARRLDAELRGDPQLQIHGVAEPHLAEPGHIVVLADPAAVDRCAACEASAFIVRRPSSGLGGAQLVCGDPRRALGQLLQIFAPPCAPAPIGVDQRAAVDATAEVDSTAWIGPFVYVGPGASVGPGSQVEPFSYIGPNACVGRDCTLGPGATLLAGCEVGDGVVLGPGAVVGHHGFGFWQDENGWHRVPSRGTVTIDDGAELGANTCVDRGTLSATTVGEGVKIGNIYGVLNPLLIVFLVPLIASLTKRVSSYKMMMVGTTISALAVFIATMPAEFFEPLMDTWVAELVFVKWLDVPVEMRDPLFLCLVTFIIVFTIGEALWSPRLMQFTAEIAPKGKEGSYIALSYLPYFAAKLVAGPMSGWLVATYVPENAENYDKHYMVWIWIGCMAVVSPIGLLLFRRLFTRAERERAAEDEAERLEREKAKKES